MEFVFTFVWERDHWGDLGVDGWVILGWICRRWDVDIWTGLVWLRIQTGGVRLWVRQWTFGFREMRGISWLAASQLAAQEGLCTVEWVSKWVSKYGIRVYFCLGNWPLGRPRRRWVGNTRMDLQEVGCGYMNWIGLAQDRDRWRTLVSAVMNLGVPWNAGNFLTSWKPVSFSRRTVHRGVSE